MKTLIMRMKKLIMITVTFVLLIPFLKGTAYASTGTISLSDPTAKVGEDVSVTVKVTATGSETIQSVNMKLSYDASALEFKSDSQATGENGTIQVSGEADSSIKTYTLNFKSLKNSTSNIKVTDYEIVDNSGNTIELSKVGASTVTISGDSQAEDETLDVNTQETMTQTTDNQTQESKIVAPPKKDVEVKIAGTPFNVCKIPQDLIPEGFEYIGYTYQGVAVDALKKDNFILFYLNQVGEEPYVFYVYDSSIDGFSIYAPVNSSLNYTVISLEENVVIPEGFSETEVSVGGVAVTAWQSTINSEYYLLYLMNSEGSKGLYLYDVVEKTVQRYYGAELENTTADTESYESMYIKLNENYNKDIRSRMQIIYIFLVITVILVFVIINLIFRLVDKKHAILDEDDDEEEDEELDVHVEHLDTSKDIKSDKKSFFGKRRKVDEKELEEYDENYEDDYEDDYQDDYEEDYEEEYEEEIDKKLKKEMKKAAKLEKKEKAKLEKAKKSQKTSDEEKEVFENSEDDFDDSDDFEVQIFDLDDK